MLFWHLQASGAELQVLSFKQWDVRSMPGACGLSGATMPSKEINLL